MADLIYPTGYLAGLLREVRVIALVGASANPERASYRVMNFLLGQGFEVIPVNPGLSGGVLLGQKVYADLASIDRTLDMVDIFRNSEAAGQTVADALKLSPLPRIIWMQLGVSNAAAAQQAEAQGVIVVMDRCPAIEYRAGD